MSRAFPAAVHRKNETDRQSPTGNRRASERRKESTHSDGTGKRRRKKPPTADTKSPVMFFDAFFSNNDPDTLHQKTIRLKISSQSKNTPGRRFFAPSPLRRAHAAVFNVVSDGLSICSHKAIPPDSPPCRVGAVTKTRDIAEEECSRQIFLRLIFKFQF